MKVLPISSRCSGSRCPRRAEECPVRDLDNAKVRTIANLCDAATEQSHTNLHGYIVLKDAIEDVLKDAIGEVGFEERGSPAVVGVVVVVVVVHPPYTASSSVSVNSRISLMTSLLIPKCCRDVSNSNVRQVYQV